MCSPRVVCWAVLAVTMICSAQNQQADECPRHAVCGPDAVAQSRQRRETKPPSTFKVGNITVVTGETWSVNIFDFVKVSRKPGGGVDVTMQPPSFLSRMFPNGSRTFPVGGSTVSQDIRRTQPKLISSKMD